MTFLALADMLFAGRPSAAGNGHGGFRRMLGGSVKGIAATRAGEVLEVCMTRLCLVFWSSHPTGQLYLCTVS